MSIRTWNTAKGKRYAARVHLGEGKYKLLEARWKRSEAKDDEAQWQLSRRSPARITARAYAERYLAAYAERNKLSSYDHAAGKIRHWLKEFGGRSIAGIQREESIDWAAENRWAVKPVITLLNAAIDDGLLERNPLKGQDPKSRGRADKDPLGIDDVERLASIAEKEHGAKMRSFVLFTAYTGLRVGEVFALEWDDIDFKGSRVMVRRRLYKGTTDLPKSGKRREVVLAPMASDALLGLDRSTKWVFTAKRGGQMTQTVLTYYWQRIAAVYGEPVTPHELRHFCGYYLYVLKHMEARLVAKQLGHANGRLVEDLYGHGFHGALDEIQAAFESEIPRLRVVEGGES